MIEARSLAMRFGRKVAVDGVSFRVGTGEVVGFLGPNGAGKSTTMRMLTGYLTPLSGTAAICGADVVAQSRLAQARLGYLPEAAGGFHNLPVADFLAFCGEARGFFGAELRRRIAATAERVDLAPALRSPIGELSKGWRQRAWLAQAILHDPPVLILDEPTDGLDPNQKQQVRDLIRDLAATRAILLSTHILEEAEEVCTRAIIVNGGCIVADQDTGTLLDERGRLWSRFRELTSEATGAHGRH